MPQNVKILNPVSGQGWTNPNRAKRYVKSGRAEWVGNAIRFKAADHRCLSAEKSAEHKHRPWIEGGGGIATLDQIRGLPVAGDAVRLIMGRRATAV